MQIRRQFEAFSVFAIDRMIEHPLAFNRTHDNDRS
jgi:hypothetical protein